MRPARRHRTLRVRGALSAVLRLPDRPAARRRSAGALASSGPRPGAARPVHSAGRGDRPDHPARRMGDSACLRRCDVMAWRHQGRRQSFAGPVQAGRTVRHDQVGAEEFRPAAGAAGNRDHRIRAAGTRARKSRLHRTAQGARNFAGARRLRHRLFVARQPDRFPVQQDQDRQVVHCRSDAQSQKHGHHLLDPDAGAGARHDGHGRGRRDPRAVRAAEGDGRQLRAGLSDGPADAARRTRPPARRPTVRARMRPDPSRGRTGRNQNIENNPMQSRISIEI